MNEDKSFEGQKINPKTWKTILSFAAARKKYFVVILLGGMVAGIIDTAMSFMSRWAIDGFMIPGTTEHAGLFAAAAIGLQLLMALLTLVYCRAAGHLEAHLSADVRKAALQAGKKLIKSVTLFDVYRGEKILFGKKQYALNFVLQDPERTLTDAEVEKTMERVLSTLQNEFGAILR